MCRGGLRGDRGRSGRHLGLCRWRDREPDLQRGLFGHDPNELAYEDVLEVFFTVHDPTTRDREGPDVGSQYRSAVYYHDEAQRETIEKFVEELEAENAYDDPIVTEVDPLEKFYAAEEKHQNYFAKNPEQPYCTVNITPKVKKVREKFAAQAAESR